MRALLAAALLGACASTGDPDPWPAAAATTDETVGWLGGRPVTYADLARHLRTRDPLAFSRSLEGLVLERVTLAEAGPAGVVVPPAVLRRETNRRMQEFRARVRAAARQQTGEEIDPAVWLERATGASLAEFREWVARHTEVELMQDRLLRLEQRQAKRVEVSILVVDGERKAADLAARLAGGEDFAALARKHSRHASAPAGGRIGFPLLEADINDASVRERLFAAKPGAVVGPFPTRGGAEGVFQVFLVEARADASRAPYARLSDRIERNLEARPVSVGEYERWRRRILLRHGFVPARAAGEAG